jgi:hypothetical protein
MILFSQPNNYIPNDVIFEVHSIQKIAIQKVSSGFAQYYPITFDADHFVYVDMMVHASITSIHYPVQMNIYSLLATNSISDTPTHERRVLELSVLSPPPPNNNNNNNNNNATTTTTTTTTPRQRRISTTIESTTNNKNNNNGATSTSNNNNYNSASGNGFKYRLSKLFTSPETLLFGDGHHNTNNNSSSRRSSAVTTSSSTTETTSNNSSFSSTDNHFTSDHSIVPMTTNPMNNRRKLSLSFPIAFTNPLSSSSSATNTNHSATNTANSSKQQIPLQSIPKLNANDFEKFFQLYCLPIIINYKAAMQASKWMMSRQEYEIRDSSLMIVDQIKSLYYSNNSNNNNNNMIGEELCPLEIKQQEIIHSLLSTYQQHSVYSLYQLDTSNNINTNTITIDLTLLSNLNEQLTSILTLAIEELNERLSLHWSLFTSTLRRMLNTSKQILLPQYLFDQQVFWKQQMIFHSRSYESSYFISSAKDEEMWEILNYHITAERETEQRISSQQLSTNNNSNIALSTSSSTNWNVYSFARGMKIFDWTIYQHPSKLPFILVEQYATLEEQMQFMVVTETLQIQSQQQQQQQYRSNSMSSTAAINSVSISSTASAGAVSAFSSTVETFHVIILQHGFLGSSTDMRQVQHALRSLLGFQDNNDHHKVFVSCFIYLFNYLLQYYILYCYIGA